MKTQNDKLKFVMEAAGECWHENVYISSVNKHLYPETNYPRETRYGESICKHCKAPTPNRNPSPDDIGKLMELAEKLELVYHFKRLVEGTYYTYIADQKTKVSTWNENVNYSKAESFLNALFVAKGGLEDE